MSRTTKSEVEGVFALLCEAAGVPQGGELQRSAFDRSEVRMTRGWSLDHNSAYGGWVVAGHSGTGTGESRPLGEYRMPAGEFVRAMRMAIRVLEASRNEEQS